MDRLVAGFHKRFSNARRASAAASIEDDFRVLRKFVHALFDLTHRNVNRAGNCAAFLDLGRVAHIDHDRLLLGFEFLLKFWDGYTFSSHKTDDTLRVMNAGYSGTPLIKKLGIKEKSEVCLVNAPEDYLELIGPLPAGVRISGRASNSTDFVHVFSSRKAELAKELRAYRAKIKPAGVVWVSWPKKSSKVPTDITEDTIREVALPLGFVDIKVCAVSEIWSGLKLVIRKELRS